MKVLRFFRNLLSNQKKCLIMVLFMISGVKLAVAQNILFGKIQTEANLRAGYVTIILKGNISADSVKIIKTDSLGNFRFQNLKSGHYTLKTAHLLFRDSLIKIQIDKPQTELNIFLMPRADISLNEVAVTARKNVIEQKIDRLVFNVENSVLATNLNGWDLLSRAPGVNTKGQDGELKINGQTGTRVMIDGRLINLSSEQLQQYLSTLNSSDIKRIEIITNPPSQYDAGGSAGIINVITKKSLQYGLTGSIRSSYEKRRHGTGNAGLNLNLREEQYSVNGIYSFSQNKSESDAEIYQLFDRNINFNQSFNSFRKDKLHYFKVAGEYYLSKNNTIGFFADGSISDKNREEGSITSAKNGLALDSTLISDNLVNSNDDTYNLNLNFRSQINEATGEKFSLDLDYTKYSAGFINPNSTYVYDPNGIGIHEPILFVNNTDRKIKILSAKADYVLPLSKDAKIDFGAKVFRIKNDNNVVFNIIKKELSSYDPLRSNEFDYTENNQALYASYSSKIGKLSFQGGLRGEFTQTSGNARTLSSLISRSYFKLFPTAYLQYAFSDDYQLNLSYSKRITRPQYNYLNPFRFYTNPYTYTTGNPFLQPSFTNSFEIRNIFYQKYVVSMYLKKTSGAIAFISNQDNQTKILEKTRINLDDLTDVGVNIIAPFRIAKWWHVDNYFLLSGSRIKSNYEDQSYHANKFTVNVSTTNAFNFLVQKKKVTAELAFAYTSPSISGLSRLDEYYDVSAGLKSSFLKDKLFLVISASDIFKTLTFKTSRTFLNQINSENFYNDSRGFKISMSYNFGKTSIKKQKERESGSQQERNRIGSQ